MISRACGNPAASVLLCLFLTVPWVGLQCLIEAFPGHFSFQTGMTTVKPVLSGNSKIDFCLI